MHNTRKGTNFRVAEIIKNKLKCDCLAAEDNPSLEEYNTIIIVVSNTGDEEISQPMEDYLFNLKNIKKQYLVCEIGNYFGLEDYCGCKKVVFQILNKLNWIKISDVSIDSLPKLDVKKLERWIDYALLNDG